VRNGTGIRTPLKPDAQWKFASDSTNSNSGATFKRTGNSRVTGQETITAKAGKFDTIVYETNFSSRNTKDPARSSDISSRTWYSTDINHWVKRSIVVRQGGQVFQNEVIELTGYGRKIENSSAWLRPASGP